MVTNRILIRNQQNYVDLFLYLPFIIGYANRSAVYYKWKMYELCSQNIELAKTSGYPKRLMDKLIKREMDCLEFINNEIDVKSEQTNYVPKLHIQANPEVPFIVNCLEMKESTDQGL